MLVSAKRKLGFMALALEILSTIGDTIHGYYLLNSRLVLVLVRCTGTDSRNSSLCYQVFVSSIRQGSASCGVASRVQCDLGCTFLKKGNICT